MPDLARLCRRYPERFAEPEDLWESPAECTQEHRLTREPSVPEDWAENGLLLVGTLREQLAKKWHQLARIEGLEREILLLKRRCDNLERTAPVTVPIGSLAPESYEVLKPFQVVVKFYEDQYVASFFDANLSASGGTQEEAVLNLKDMLIDTFEILNEVEDDKLGPGPQLQKAVLKQFLSRR